MPDKFVRGVKVKEPPKQFTELKFSEVVYTLLEVRRQKHPDISKAEFMNYLDKAWDAHAKVCAELGR